MADKFTTTRGAAVWADAVTQRNGSSRVSDVEETVFTVPLVSDWQMPVAIGDLIVAIGMLLLYVEVVKAVRHGGTSSMDHVLAFILFAAMASELVFVPRATSPTLLLLAVLGFGPSRRAP